MPTRAKPKNWSTPVDTLLRNVPPAASTATSFGAQVRLLALLGSASPFNELLDGLARYVESWADGLLCTVLVVDGAGQQLVPGCAPSIPASYVAAIGPVPIQDGRGSCGTAAATRAMVVVEDIEHSPLWAEAVSTALSHGLRACWSVPILDDSGVLLGTLAMYYRERRAPTAEETDLIKFAGALAGFVIQRHRDAEKLTASEARLEAAVAGTELGVWDGEVNGDYLWTSDWCERLDIDQCNGPDSLKRWRAQIHPEDVGRYVQAGDESIRGAIDHYVVEYRIRTRGGQWRWVHERGKVTARDADGNAKHYVGVCIDIEPRKRLETALRNAEDRYELAIGAAQLPIWEYDVPSDVVTGNVYWHRALGYEADEQQVTDRVERWLSDVHPDDAARHHRVFASDAADVNGYYQSEFRMRTATGDYKWLLDRGRVVERDPDGAPRRVVGVSIDIDVRKRMEATLRASEERFRSAFEFAAIGMALVAIDGRWLRVNASFCAIVGYTADELLGMTFRAITHPEDLNADAGNMQRTLDGSLTHFDMEKRYIHKSGRVVWALLSVSLARDSSGAPLYFISQIQDITARKRLETALGEAMHQEQQRLGKEMHDGLGQELAGLAYLVSSLANEAARIQSPLAPELQRIAGVAGHTIVTCRNIARGVSPLTESRGSLVESLRRIADIASSGGRARIEFQAIENAPITLPLETLDHLHRIAQEALTNALKHSDADTISLLIEIEPARVRIEVADDGRGLGPPGTRSDGLGLDSMRQRAAAIGAQLRIRNQRRGGASVVCECPQFTATR